MCDLSLAEGKTFNAEGKISCHRIAVATVEPGDVYSIAAMAKNIFQRYIFFRIRQLLFFHIWHKAWTGYIFYRSFKSCLAGHICADAVLLYNAAFNNRGIFGRYTFRIVHS